MTAGATVLEVRNLGVAYGGILAVREVSFEVRRGEIVTLIGGNGAGKSSILRAISGLVPRAGTVTYEGRDLARVPAHGNRNTRRSGVLLDVVERLPHDLHQFGRTLRRPRRRRTVALESRRGPRVFLEVAHHLAQRRYQAGFTHLHGPDAS